MTTTQMKYFLETARRMNFTVAAANLYMAQPTLSRHIMSMEEELGVKLFIRSRNTVLLTPAGKELYASLSRICDDYDEVCQRIQRIERGITGELNIALFASQHMPRVCAEAVRRFSEEYPNIAVILTRMDASEIARGMRAGDIDIGIVIFSADVEDFEFEIREINQERMYLAVSSGSELAKLPEISVLDIPALAETMPFIRSPAEPLLAQNDAPLDVLETSPYVRTVESVDHLPLYIECGLGMAVLSDNCILTESPLVAKIPIPDHKPVSLAMCKRKNTNNPATKQFMRVFDRVFQEKS